MKSFIFTLIINCVLSLNASSQISKNTEFTFLDSIPKSDFDYFKLKRLEKYPKGDVLLNTVFKPIKGKYTVFRFLLKDSMYVTDDLFLPVTWILILKTDKEQKVKDAFFYNLNTPEYPVIEFMYRMNVNSYVLFKQGFNLEQFHFYSSKNIFSKNAQKSIVKSLDEDVQLMKMSLTW